jgi:hypothetical protein
MSAFHLSPQTANPPTNQHYLNPQIHPDPFNSSTSIRILIPPASEMNQNPPQVPNTALQSHPPGSHTSKEVKKVRKMNE